MKKYPYQNLELVDMKGEAWDDIPGLDGYFLVSNYGRVKGLEYEMEYSDGRIYIKPERIIKPAVNVTYNSFVKDFVSFLTTGITLSGKRYSFSIPRLVYFCFIRQFNLDDKSVVVLCKDRNNFNIRPSNLKLATLSEKQKRTLNLKRREPFVIDDEMKRKIGKASRITHSKKITQYNMQGKKLKTYASVVKAAQRTGINAGYIRLRARGSEPSARGFIWRYGNADQIDITAILQKKEERRLRYKRDRGTKVTQCTMDGSRVATFPTIEDAAKATGIWPSAIASVVRKKGKSAGGFFWKK